jgi:hypothetical protein
MTLIDFDESASEFAKVCPELNIHSLMSFARMTRYSALNACIGSTVAARRDGR